MSKPWGKVPAAVIGDKRLSAIAVRVYAVMACSTSKSGGGGVVKLGMRLLADLTCSSRSQVGRAMRELIEAGHVKSIIPKSGARSIYTLTHPCHSPGLQSEEVLYSEGGVKITRKRGATRLAKVG